jgi:hypothetical protein
MKMKQNERSIAFFATMLITAGISTLNFEYPAFKHNLLSYLALFFGVSLAVIFLIMRLQNRH